MDSEVQTETERFPWTTYHDLLGRAAAICRDRDRRGRNHAKPLLETYTVGELMTQLSQRYKRLEGALEAIRTTPESDIRAELVDQMVEDCLDDANYALFLAMKAQYELMHGRWQ